MDPRRKTTDRKWVEVISKLFRFDVGLQSFFLLCLGPGSSWPKLGLEILDLCDSQLTVTLELCFLTWTQVCYEPHPALIFTDAEVPLCLLLRFAVLSLGAQLGKRVEGMALKSFVFKDICPPFL